LPEEWKEIWDATPKKGSSVEGDTANERIDCTSFVQIYREVDDLFEDGGDDDNVDDEDSDTENDNDVEDETVAATIPQEGVGGGGSSSGTVLDDELDRIYQSICDDQKLVSKDSLKNWEEIQNLMTEGLLGDDEFDELWEKAVIEEGNYDNQSLTLDGFLAFNVALDSLFEFDDDQIDDDVDDDDDDDVEINSSAVETTTPKPMVEQGDMPAGVLFSQLADEKYLVGMDDLTRWVELQEMLEEGDLLSSELQQMYDKVLSKNSFGKLTEEAFLKLYEEIDSLFDDDEMTVEEDNAPVSVAQQSQSDENRASAVKQDLLGFLDIIQDEADETMLPCGLDATEKDQKQVLNIVSVLEQLPTNLIKKKKGVIEVSDVVGAWTLVYSSSSAMKFNQGLSGIGGSFPNGRCAGVKQDLRTTKFLNEVEYKERIEVKPSTASFDVTVTGSWDLRTSVSLFTGQTTIVVNVEPERVNYGPTSTRADHWKSLGPLNMLDLSYLDEDLRVMRGCTSADTLFIFKKES
jgi:hypothetical protein